MEILNYIGNNEYQDLRDGGQLSEYQRSSLHVLGSLFMKGLEVYYNCNANCAAGIWRRLAEFSSDHNREVTNQEIKAAAEAETGRNPTSLFELLELR